MDLLRNRYNPQAFYDRSFNLLDQVGKGEAQSWYEHPCTQALLASLEGDLSGIVVMWLGGGYAEQESTAGTAQKQAKAIGMAQAIEDVINHIQEIRTAKESQE